MSDYVDRKLDLLVMQAEPSATGKSSVGLSLGTSGMVAAGIQKVAQEWLIAFLTVRGSVKSDPTYGTTFLTKVQPTNKNDTNKISNEFQAAQEQIMDWRSSMNVDTGRPTDEQLKSAELISLSESGGDIALTVRIDTLAGESRTYVTPISFVTK